jgi:hypothetical protein
LKFFLAAYTASWSNSSLLARVGFMGELKDSTYGSLVIGRGFDGRMYQLHA